MKKKNRRKIRKAWQMFLKIYTMFSVVSLFLFTPAIKFGNAMFPRVMTAISCLWLLLIVIANIDEF